jgi:protein farnesyltransferase subunit beta
MRYSVIMQGEAIEGGGFRGRSNKLVDGCYSWWVGGGIPVIEALGLKEKKERKEQKREKVEARIEVENGEEWEDVIRELVCPLVCRQQLILVASPPLFNKTALQEFILLAAQNEPGNRGGLRDKPGK